MFLSLNGGRHLMVKLETNEILNNIQKRLDILIALSIKKELKEDKSLTMREVISFLDSMDLKYTDIAKLFGKSSSYIASEITLLKKRSKKSGRK